MAMTSGSQQASGGAPGDGKWTVMVFMSADRIEGDVPLVDAAIADINEMGVIGSNDLLNVFVQVYGVAAEPRRAHVKTGTTWQQIAADATTIVPEPERKTKDGLALEAFMRYAFDAAQHNPHDRSHYSMLVLWGHAYDFGFARVRTASGTPDAIDFAELSAVLDRIQRSVQDYYKLGEAPRLDVVAFDACDVATVELAFELAPYAKYLLGSQVGVPIPGWPYDRILKQLHVPFGRLMSPPEFGVWAVRRYVEAYAPQRPVSLSMLNLEKAVAVAARVKVLSELILAVIEAEPQTAGMFAALFERSLTFVERPYLDAADLCVNLARESGDERIAQASRALGDVLIAAQFPVVGMSKEPGPYPFVVAHGRNAGDTAKLNGVSLYAPVDSAEDDLLSARTSYESMKFAQRTRWSELVHGLAAMV